MDLHENTDANTVTATFEFPGFKKEDVQIDLHNGKLTVAAESKVSSEHEEGGYVVRERRYGKFSRTLQLAQGVKVNILNSEFTECSMMALLNICPFRMKKSKRRWRMGS